MVNIFLTGKLGTLFGRKWRLNVRSPGEALRAINANVKGKLFQYLNGDGAKRYYKVAVQKKDNLLTKEEIATPSGAGDIYIMPTIRGSGDNPFAQILIGAVLVVAAFYTAGTITAAAGSGIFGSATAAVAGGLAAAGISMVIGGITQLLTPTPKFDDNTASQKNSSVFQGNASTISQGGGVPIAYGRVLMFPMPISISLQSYDQASTAADIGTVEVEELPGGGYEYS